MGNQVTNQHTTEPPRTLETHNSKQRAQAVKKQQQQQQQEEQQQKKKAAGAKEARQKRPTHWLPGRKKRPSEGTKEVNGKDMPSQQSPKHQASNGITAEYGKCSLVLPPITMATDTATAGLAPLAVDNTIVVADLTPSPDSANRTWTSEADTPTGCPQQLVRPSIFADETEAVPTRNRQRDSGVSQLSTEEFDRVYEEMCQTVALQQQQEQEEQQNHQSPPQVQTQQHIEELLAPKLRAKLRTPSFRRRERAHSVSSFATRTEELLLLRQELITSTPQRRSACCAINDDHMFPDSVTPTKVDSGLLADYDVPYMDDENFFVYDDWYVTDDKRWSYLRRSEVPQLADWGDCRLTEPVPNSAVPTPHSTPTKLFGGRRALFGLCFGAKSTQA